LAVSAAHRRGAVLIQAASWRVDFPQCVGPICFGSGRGYADKVATQLRGIKAMHKLGAVGVFPAIDLQGDFMAKAN
jgi:hypothetical protein